MRKLIRRAKAVGVAGMLVLGVAALSTHAAAQSDTEGLPPELADDAWLKSLPTPEIVVGDLDPKYGELGKTPKPEDAPGSAGGSGSAGATASGGSGGGAAASAGSGGRGGASGSGGGADSGGGANSGGAGGRGGAAVAPSSADADVLNPPAAAVNEAEPNNTFGTVQRVGPSASASGRIDPAGDTDWYSFEAPRRGVIDVTFTGLASSLDVRFQVHDANNYNFTGWISPKVNDSATETVTVDLKTAGRYYVVVNDATGKAEGAAYTVTWKYHSGDRYEPNDSFGTATSIGRNTNLAVSTLPLKDTDWFTFEVPNRGVANIAFTGVTDDLDLSFQVHDANNYNFTGWITPKVRDSATERQVVDLKTAGRYYLVVADSGGDARSPKPYTLKLTTELADRHEPNDALGKAVPLPATASTPASLLPLGDTDWYALDIKHPGQLEVAFTGVPDPLSVSFQVHDPENYNFTGWLSPKMSDGNTEPTVVDLKKAGVYYLVVAEADSDARSSKAFDVKTAYTAADPHEPNNALGTAKPMALGGSVQANILPLKDVDWFVVDVPRAGTLEAVVSGVADEFGPSLQIHNIENYNMTGWKVPKIRDGVAEPVTAEAKTPGRYYILVADDGHKHRVTEPYTLTVNLK